MFQRVDRDRSLADLRLLVVRRSLGLLIGAIRYCPGRLKHRAFRVNHLDVEAKRILVVDRHPPANETGALGFFIWILDYDFLNKGIPLSTGRAFAQPFWGFTSAVLTEKAGFVLRQART